MRAAAVYLLTLRTVWRARGRKAGRAWLQELLEAPDGADGICRSQYESAAPEEEAVEDDAEEDPAGTG